jgi:hypothetical protein
MPKKNEGLACKLSCPRRIRELVWGGVGLAIKNRPGYGLYLRIRRALLVLLGAHMCVAFAAFVWPCSGF